MDPWDSMAPIDGAVVRAARLELDGAPIKAEGLALGGSRCAWIAIDPDDVEAPAQVCKIARDRAIRLRARRELRMLPRWC